jgi:hypothetical protein
MGARSASPKKVKPDQNAKPQEPVYSPVPSLEQGALLVEALTAALARCDREIAECRALLAAAVINPAPSTLGAATSGCAQNVSDDGGDLHNGDHEWDMCGHEFDHVDFPLTQKRRRSVVKE